MSFDVACYSVWLSITITGSVTQAVKVAVGRPRPGGFTRTRMDDSSAVLISIDLISRCEPLAGSEDPLWGLSTIDICTQTSKHILDDGWRSFPSGHSSCMSVYLSSRVRLTQNAHSVLCWTWIPHVLPCWQAPSV
jgi:diacylglycerol diphosphate phosphatase/phosphatidate phosphatase